MRCLKCGNDNLEPAHLCQVCGAVLPQNPLDIGLIRPGAGSEQPLTSMLYQALIGPVHTDYYLEHFARFDAAGKGGFPAEKVPRRAHEAGWQKEEQGEGGAARVQ